MATNALLAPPKKKDSSKTEFVWSDDEVELLLNISNEYKVSKATESTDWESVRSKYKDIFDLFVDALPEESNASFPHKKDEVKQASMTSKLRAIRLKFRQAVDSGRRSGHGRVVMIYYELCQKLWGGSPATETISHGLESTEILTDAIDTTTSSDIGDEIESSCSPHTHQHDESDVKSIVCDEATIQQRRKLLDEKLKNYKQEKLKRKLPVDFQMLSCAQEELGIKKQLLEQMSEIDRRHADNMERISHNMERLSNSMADGYKLLKQMTMYQQPPAPMYHSQPFAFMHGSSSSFVSPANYPQPNDNHVTRTDTIKD